MMNLGSYFQSELKEISDREGLIDDHYNLLFQSQNQSQKFTKKQVADKLREYEFLMSQIDAQEDPMETWEEYLDFLITYQDRTSNEGNQLIFQELEKFLKYSCERDYIKSDLRCVRFWIEYSDMCKDKEDVIYYMEENEIGVDSAFFYEELCKVTEGKMDYSQADKYILEGKYKQAQPEAKMNEVIQKFEQRMEQRISRLRELTSIQMMHDNQQSDSKKRKRIEFDMRNDGYREQSKPIIRKVLDKNNKMVKEEYICNSNVANKRRSNGQWYGANKQKQKKVQLPDKVYLGDGINIYVDEEYRQNVFPKSTLLVTEYLNLVEEINEYLANNHQDLVQSQYSQKSFQSQQLQNSAQLGTKNKSELLNALNEDMFYFKKPVFENDLEISWIGREEKKYKSFEVMESQKNSQQIVQFNMCDFIFQNSNSKLTSSPQIGFNFINTTNSNNIINSNNNNYNNNIFQVNNNGNNNIKRQEDRSSIAQIKSPQKADAGILECDSIFGSQSPYIFSNKLNQSYMYQSSFNNGRNKRQQGKYVHQQDPSPLQNSIKRLSDNYQINEDSSNYQKMEDFNSQQYKQNIFEQSDFTPPNYGTSPFEAKQQKPSRFSLSQSKGKLNGQQNNHYLNSSDSNGLYKQNMQRSPMSQEKYAYRDDSNNKFHTDNIKKFNLTSEHSKINHEESKSIFNFSKDYTKGNGKIIQNKSEREEDDAWNNENSCLNKAFHNDMSKDIDNVDSESDSLDFYSEQYSFLQNRNASKSSKLSQCVRSRKSAKFDKLDIFFSGNKQNGMIEDSPLVNKMQISSKRKSNNRKSVEKLRNNYQPIPSILQNNNINNQSFLSIQFSQEFSQVNNIFTQDGFFSPSSIDENFFKINPPPANNNNNKKKKSKNNRTNQNAQDSDNNKENDSEKSLTEKEDEEINDMLNQYCFSNENKYIGQSSNSNLIDTLKDKENMNLIINQRRSKSQNSMPRKALQQLPIEEFIEDAILDNPILPLSLSNNHNEAFHTSSMKDQDNNNNQLFYSHSQFRNSRNDHNRNREEQNLIFNEEQSDRIDKENNNHYEYILTKSMCEDDFFNDQENQSNHYTDTRHYQVNNQFLRNKEKSNKTTHTFSMDIFKEDQIFYQDGYLEDKSLKNNKKIQKQKRNA